MGESEETGLTFKGLSVKRLGFGITALVRDVICEIAGGSESLGMFGPNTLLSISTKLR
jgi:hypothetical protein